MQQHVALSLFLANRAALIDYASGIIGSRAPAEEVVQDAWLRLDEAYRRQVLKEPLRYLYRIVRNLALDERRRARREALVATGGADADVEASADDGPSPEAVALHKDEFERVLEAIAELPERTRIALEMHCFGGCKLREIAASLGISRALAHLLVADGIQHCKHRLGWP